MRLARRQVAELDDTLEAVGQVVGAEAAEEFGVGVLALRLRDQVLQLVGLHPADLDLEAGQVTRQHRQLLLAAHGEQRAFAEDAQLGRVRRHGDELLRTLAHQVATVGLELRLDLHIDHTAHVGLQLERVRAGVVALTGDGCQRELGRRGDHRIGDLARVRPRVGLFALLLFLLRRVLERQQPGCHVLCQVALVHELREVDDEHMLGLEALVGHDQRRHLADVQAIEAGHAHRLTQLGWAARTPGLGQHTGADVERERGRLLRHRQRGRVHEGAEFELVVAHRVGRGLTANTQHTFRLARHAQLDALLQLNGVDRVAEAQLEHTFLQLGVDRVDVELGLA